MSSDAAQLIKEKLDIVDFLRQYIELKPAGKNFKARCPFHKEKTPSFMISPERQSWHCFGACSEGGDVIKFLMKYENLEFYDALKVLAEKTGVDLKIFGNRDLHAHNALYNIMDVAKNFFKENFSQSQFVKDYLKERGLSAETIGEFEIGLAPAGSDLLTRHLLKLGHNILDIEKAGLAFKTERGTYWDRFRDRVMFPIYNHVGKAVAFTGRILPGKENENVGKYVNSPETPIFQKSKILYGFHRTKNDIREARSAVLVEGQMDFLMMRQDGIKNVAATSGTALTPDHLLVLRRVADELVLSFDSDEAGQMAAERSIDLAGAHDFSVRLLVIDESLLKPGSETSVASQSVPQSGTSRSSTSWKDPADVVKVKPGLMKKLAEQSKSAMDYYFHRHLKNIGKDIKAKKQSVRLVLGKIKNISSAIERSHWLIELSRRVGISEQALLEEMENLKVAVLSVEREAAPVAQPPEDLSRRDIIFQRLFGVLVHMKSDLQKIKNYVQYIPEKYLPVYESAIDQSKKSPTDLNELMGLVSMRFSLENGNLEMEKLEKESETLLRELKLEYLKERRQQIGELIKKLEYEGEEVKLSSALQEFSQISKELQEG